MRRASIGLTLALLVSGAWAARAQPAGTAAFPPEPPAPSAEPAPSASAPPAASPAPVEPPAAAPAPAPAPAAPPAAQPLPPPTPAEYPFAPPQPAPAPLPKRSGLVGVLRLGLLVGGSGEIQPECSGSCAGFDTESTDFDDTSSVALSADLLVHLSPELRLGAGLLYVPSTALEVDGARQEDDLGSDLSAMLVAEGVFDVGRTTAITLRGQAGLIALFPGGELEDGIDELKQICGSADGACEVDDGPYAGLTLGGGPGLRFALEKVALRLDLLFQWYRVENLLRTQGDGANGELDVSDTWTGTRFFLAGGLEL